MDKIDTSQTDRRRFLKQVLAATATLSTPLGLQAATKPGDEIVELDAVRLSQAILARQVSCREVMLAYLTQIDRLNPKVNAIVSLQDREGLLKQADERDAQLAKGQRLGWMHGFPHAPKDLSNTAGILTTQGSPIFRNNIPKTDAIHVERMRRAGAIFIGKTNTPEIGLGSHTYNTIFGTTGNAFDPSKSAGGSSGGAAVATALRMMPVADGSDLGGSIRNPAGWNNIYGLRPSFGRVPLNQPEVFFQQLGYDGPLARTVPDLAMLLSVQSGYDARVPLSIDQDPAMFTKSLKRDHKGVRIGWMGDFNGYLPTDPGVMELCQKALKHFETIGCTVEAVQPDFSMERLWQCWLTMRGFLAAGYYGGLYANEKTRAMLKPEAIWEIEQGMKLSTAQVWRAAVDRTTPSGFSNGASRTRCTRKSNGSR